MNFEDFARRQPDVPPRPKTQDQHLARLHALPEPGPGSAGGRPHRGRRRQRRLVVAAAAATLVVAGTATAAAFGAFAPATRTESAFCFGSDSLAGGDNRIEYAVAGGVNGRAGNAVAVGLDICAAYWRAGVFQIGHTPDVQRPPISGQYPIPALSACVLPAGDVGVFPGDQSVCAQLGLPALAPSH